VIDVEDCKECGWTTSHDEFHGTCHSFWLLGILINKLITHIKDKSNILETRQSHILFELSKMKKIVDDS
jgi:hypothetical protein